MKIIIPNRVAPLIEQRILSLYPDMQIVISDDEGMPLGDASDATIFMRWWTSLEGFRLTLSMAPNVKWVYTPSAGIDHLDLEMMRERGITLTNAAGAHAIPIAEFVMMFILTHMKQSRILMNYAREDFEATEQTKLEELDGKTMAIVGLGSIGQETAKRAKAFGMRVIGSRRRPQPTKYVDVVVSDDEWHKLLPDADVIVIATPLTDITRGMVDATAFAKMKPSAYIVNVARGQVINTEDLIVALCENRIAGAGLDVLPEEPLPAEHPLWDAPNVWITPHISYSSPKTRGRMMDLFITNLERYMHGQKLLNIVNFDEGY
ncbi:MAG: D-2-hydroxyacid dehydrogenase [Chloroflexales bacterium]|nr:D-2-hydroxyacid dehydrogenase [Chloroflexales bacterium]